MGEHPILWSSDRVKSEVDRLGLGISLYFRFLKNIMLWFFIFSVLGAFQIYVNIKCKKNKILK